YFRAAVTCGETPAYSSSVLINTVYCIPTSPSSEYEYISNVTVGVDLNNTTIGDNYTFYSSPIANLTIGEPTPISIGISDSYASDNIFLFIDWNQDKDWSDSNENIALTYTATSGNFTAIGTITPPEGALLGNTRMRIKLMDGNNS